MTPLPTPDRTAWDIAQDIYRLKGWDWDNDIKTYARFHYLYADPQCIIFAQLHTTHWYIHLAVGKNCLGFFLSLMPVSRPYIAWARGLRNGPLKYYKTERLKRLL